MKDGLEEAIRAAGGVVALARALKLSHQSVSAWDKVPHMRVIAVEKITGINRAKLRPDLYPSDKRPQR